MYYPPNAPPPIPPRPNDRRMPAELAPIRQKAGPPRDQLWEVLHSREQSASPRPPARVPEPQAPPHGRGAAVRNLSAPSRPEEAGGAYPGEGPQILPRKAPIIALGGLAAEGQLGADIKGGQLLKPRSLSMGLEHHSETMQWLERKIEIAQAELRAEITQRWGNFEQGDRRFKDWVQREQEQLHAHVQQVKAAAVDGREQQSKHSAALQQQDQKLESRMQELEMAMAQNTSAAQSNGQAIQALQAATLYGGHGAGNSNMSMVADSLRAELQQEANNRSNFEHEIAAKFRELNGQVLELNSRLQQSSSRQQQFLEQQIQRAQAADPSQPVEALRSEVDMLRSQLQKSFQELQRKCEEVESSSVRNVSQVQEAALTAARELWEEHQGVVAECRSSLASLRSILETKDKLAAQLQSIQQQQRSDDRQELLTHLQSGLDALVARTADLDGNLAKEQQARAEGQKAFESHYGRLAQALEEANAGRIGDFERLSTELEDLKKYHAQGVEGVAKSFERRVSETFENIARRLDDLDGKVDVSKATQAATEDRFSELVRGTDAELKDVEGRLKRQLSDLQSLFNGRLSQLDFDLRAALRTNFSEISETARRELAAVEQTAAEERTELQARFEARLKELAATVAKAKEDMDAKLVASEGLSLKRQQQMSDSLSAARQDLVQFSRDARTFTDQKCQDLASNLEIMSNELRGNFERMLAGIAKDLTTMDDRLTSSIAAVEKKTATHLSEELALARETTRTEIERAVEHEQGARLKAETEHLSTVQRRLQAHEELTGRKLEALQAKQDDSLATLSQEVEAKMVAERHTSQRALEDLAKELRDTDAVAAQEISGLDSFCGKLVKEVKDLESRLSIEVERQTTELDARLTSETAALSAQLAVGDAGNTAEIKEAMVALQAALEDLKQVEASGRSELREELSSEVAQISNKLQDADDYYEETWNEIRQNINQAKDDLGSMVQEVSANLDSEGKAWRSSAEEQGKGLTAMGARLDDHRTELLEALSAARSYVDQSVKDEQSHVEATVGLVGERLQEVQVAVHALENEFLRRFKEVEEVIAESQHRVEENNNEVQKQIEDMVSEWRLALDEVSSNLDEFEKETKGAAQALEDKLAAAIGHIEEAQVNTSTQLDVLDDRLDEEIDRAKRVEGELQSANEAARAKQEEEAASVRAEMTKTTGHVQETLETLKKDVQSKLEDAKEEAQSTQKEAIDRIESLQKQLLEDLEATKGALREEVKTAQNEIKNDQSTLEKAVKAQEEARLIENEQQKNALKNGLATIRGDLSADISKVQKEAENAVSDLRKKAEAQDGQTKDLVAALERQKSEASDKNDDLVRKLDKLRKDAGSLVQDETNRSKLAEADLIRQLEVFKGQSNSSSNDLQTLAEQLQREQEEQQRRVQQVEESLRADMQANKATIEQSQKELKEKTDKLQKQAEEQTIQSEKIKNDITSKLEEQAVKVEKAQEEMKAKVEASTKELKQQTEKLERRAEEQAIRAEKTENEVKAKMEEAASGSSTELEQVTKKLQEDILLRSQELVASNLASAKKEEERKIMQLQAEIKGLEAAQERKFEDVNSKIKSLETNQEQTKKKFEEADENSTKASSTQVKEQNEAVGELKLRVAELHGAQDRKMLELQAQIKGVEASQERELMGLQEKIKALKVEELRSKLEEVETSQEQTLANQAMFNKAVDQRQDEVSDQVESFSKKVDESIKQCLGDISDLQERYEKERSERMDSQAKQQGFEEQLGHLIQTTAELLNKIDEKPKA